MISGGTKEKRMTCKSVILKKKHFWTHENEKKIDNKNDLYSQLPGVGLISLEPWVEMKDQKQSHPPQRITNLLCYS